MFICNRNKSRSPLAAQASRLRRETETTSLDHGLDGLALLSDDDLKQRITELTKDNILRIFIDARTESGTRVQQALQELVAQEVVDLTDFELITIKDLIKENQSDADFLRSLTTAMLDD